MPSVLIRLESMNGNGWVVSESMVEMVATLGTVGDNKLGPTRNFTPKFTNFALCYKLNYRSELIYFS